jgi:anaerobic dimethyl sulfoxide reductase subunit C
MNVREWALPAYTILMQLAAGTLLCLWLIHAAGVRRHGREAMDRLVRIPILAILVTIVVAVAGSHFHLSRPHFSLLAVLNVRSSWLSREVLFTMVFLTAVGGLVYRQWFEKGRSVLKGRLNWLVAVASGSLTVYCMSMIYLLPTQASWNSPLTLVSFLVSTLLLGATAVSVMLVMDLKFCEVANSADIAVRGRVIRESFTWLAAVALVTAVALLLLNTALVADLAQGDITARTSLELRQGLYRPLLGLRYGALLAGTGWFALTAILLHRHRTTPSEITTPIYVSCVLVLIAEIMGRFLFYATHVRVGI